MKDWHLHVERAREGNRSSFDILIGQFGDMAVGYAYSILGDFHLAEDAAQEAFIEAYFGISKLRESAAFPAWFRKVIYKYCDRQLRKRQLPTIPLDSIGELTSGAESPLESIQKQELHDSVMFAVNSLSEKERIAVTLVYLGGNSLAQVGSFLDVPASTIKSRLYSARQHLKDRMVELVKDAFKSHAPGDELTKRVSKVLDGIERIHWSTTSCLCFAGSTVACMHYIGEQLDNDYVMGISGGAFKLFWYPGWSPANCDLLLYGEEPIRRTFNALGYDYTYISNRDRTKSLHPQEFYQDRFVRSIDSGHPVIAIGIVGPPECCVVAGYDEAGKILYGRSYFQDNPFGGENYEQEAAGYFRTDDWYSNLYGCILIGQKRNQPSPSDVMKQSLEWAIRLAYEPYFDSPGFAMSTGSLSHDSPGYVEGCDKLTSETHISGLAAYDAIIEALKRDEDFPADNFEILSFRCMALGNDGLWLLAGKRHAAAGFLRSMVVHDIPAKDQLMQAADIYEQEAKLLCENMHLIPGWNCSPEDQQIISESTRRNQIAEIVVKAKQLEIKAVELLKQAFQEYR